MAMIGSGRLRGERYANPVFVLGRERLHSIFFNADLLLTTAEGRMLDARGDIRQGRFLLTKSAIIKQLKMSKEERMIVTLCGSNRFEAEYREWNEKLSLLGHVVFTLTSYPSFHGGVKDWYTPEQKEMLDRVHLAKIKHSDAILVLNKGGYIGYSCAREIVYAESLGVQVRFLEQTIEASEEAKPILDTMKASPSWNQLNHAAADPMEWPKI